MFKTIVNKVQDAVNSVNETISKIKGIHQAVSNKANFEVDEVQITNIILDEAARLQKKAPSFKLTIGRLVDMMNRRPVLRQRTQDYVDKKLGALKNIKFVNSVAVGYVDASVDKVLHAIMGETLSQEFDDRDEIIIYPEQLRFLWWNVAFRGESIEEIVRQIVRHEFRHAEQITEMRKRGGSKMVRYAFNNETSGKFSYGEGPMEKDAWSGQHLPEYRPIGEFIEDMLNA